MEAPVDGGCVHWRGGAPAAASAAKAPVTLHTTGCVRVTRALHCVAMRSLPIAQAKVSCVWLQDISQNNNLKDKFPEKLKELQALSSRGGESPCHSSRLDSERIEPRI